MYLIQKNHNFQEHPFYDWLDTTLQIFNETDDINKGEWQGGGNNSTIRYSPNKMETKSILEYFGRNEVERQDKQKRLNSIVNVLETLLNWIDGKMFPVAKNMSHMQLIRKFPSTLLTGHYSQCVNQIPADVDFGMFRCSVFLTICSGSGMLKEGKHLMQLIVPCKNMASHKHIMKASYHGHNIQRRDNSIQNNDMDDVLIQLASELKQKFPLRTVLEVLLCESNPTRFLNLKDTFIVGGIIFDMDDNGRILFREYGDHNSWTYMTSEEDKNRESEEDDSTITESDNKSENSKESNNTDNTNNIVFIKDDTELKNIIDVINTNPCCVDRPSPEAYIPTHEKTPPISHHFYYHKDYFSSQFCKRKKIDVISTKVIHINNGTIKADLSTFKEIETMKGGNDLIKYMHSKNMEIQLVAEHREEKQDTRKNTIFTWHKDKKNLSKATFIVTQGECFSILALPQDTTLQDDNVEFQNFYKQQSQSMKQQLDEFLGGAKFHMNNKPFKLFYFHLYPGRLLSFIAAEITHATVIPESDVQRVMWIAYDLKPASP